MEETLITE